MVDMQHCELSEGLLLSRLGSVETEAAARVDGDRI